MQIHYFLLVILINNAAGQNWSYSRPDKWPGHCNTGKKQSPININVKNVVGEQMPPLKYVNYDRNFVTIIENEEYTVSLRFDDEGYNKPSVRGSVIQDDYTLENIHFHWSAEHTINNKRYPLEAHFVHYKTEAGNLSNAMNIDNGIVVLAVFYELSDASNDAFDVITSTVGVVARRPHRPFELDGQISPTSLLSNDLDSFYAYEGSLTTPNCNEVVTWIVYDRPSSIEKSQLEKLSNIYTEDGERLVRNNRPLQALNGREVLYSRDNNIR